MKKSLLLLLLLLWIAGCTWYYMCKVPNQTGHCNPAPVAAKTVAPVKQDPIPAAFNILDGDDFSLASLGHIKFNKGGDGMAISPKAQEALPKLIDYLKANPSKHVLVNGLYGADGSTPQVGEQRASNLKDHLVTNGVNSDQIQAAHVKTGDLSLNEAGDTVLTPLTFVLSTALSGDLSDEDKKALLDRLRAGIKVHFESGSDLMDFNGAIHKYTDDLKYATDHLGVKAATTGYTDNSGNAKGNQRLSEKRAKAVRARLISEKHIDKALIKATGKGIANPIGDNNTEEGKAENRRVEITIVE